MRDVAPFGKERPIEAPGHLRDRTTGSGAPRADSAAVVHGERTEDGSVPIVRTRSADAIGSAGNKATFRVLLVLSEFAGHGKSLGVSELSKRLRMTKNMVHRALTTLVHHGYIVRDTTGTRYELGPRVAEFGGFGLTRLDVPSFCAPFMQRLAEISGETVSLLIPTQRSSVVVAGVVGPGPIARGVPLGRLNPLHASSASRVILANLHDDEIEAYLQGDLERFTETTLVEPDAIWEDVRTVRGLGYALGTGDRTENVGSVSFAILDRDGRPHGALTVAGPSKRFTTARIQEILAALRAVIVELNRYSRLYHSTYSTQAIRGATG